MKLFAAAAFLYCCGLSSAAENLDDGYLSAFCKSAAERSPQVQAAAAALNQANRHAGNLNLKFLPSATGTLDSTKEKITSIYENGGRAQGPIYSRSAGLTVIIPVLHPQDIEEQRSGSILVRRATLDLDVAYQQALYAAASAALKYLTGLSKQAVLSQKVELAKRAHEISERKSVAGSGTGLEADDALASFEEAEAELAGQATQTATQRLEVFTHAQSDADIDRIMYLREKLPTRESNIANILQNAPEQNNISIEQDEIDVELARGDLRYKAAAFLPKVDITVSRSKSYLSRNVQVPEIFDTPTTNVGNSVGIQVSMPIFDLTNTYGPEREAAAKLEQTQYQLDAEKIVSRRELLSIKANLNQQETQLRLLHRQQELLRTMIAAKAREVHAGHATEIEYVALEQRLISVNLNEIDAWTNMAMAALEYEQRSGNLTPQCIHEFFSFMKLE